MDTLTVENEQRGGDLSHLFFYYMLALFRVQYGNIKDSHLVSVDFVFIYAALQEKEELLLWQTQLDLMTWWSNKASMAYVS